MPSKSPSLVRLNVRLPESIHATLRDESDATAIPMSALVRQLVVEWVRASQKPTSKTPSRP